MTIASIATRLLGLGRRFWSRFAPLPAVVEPLKVAADLFCRSRGELVLENAALRHQLGVLRRRSPKPRLRPGDRMRLLLAAALLPVWRQAVLIVQPETILRWHRSGYRLFWRHRCRSRNRRRLDAGTIDLIRDMTKHNRLWGAERIRGELLKLGIRVAKRTIQKYMSVDNHGNTRLADRGYRGPKIRQVPGISGEVRPARSRSPRSNSRPSGRSSPTWSPRSCWEAHKEPETPTSTLVLFAGFLAFWIVQLAG